MRRAFGCVAVGLLSIGCGASADQARIDTALLTDSATVAAARALVRQADDTLVIEHASVLPMDRDTVLADHTVLIVADRIVWIGPSAQARAPGSARRVNGSGKFLIPGLADMHVHLERSIAELPRYVAAGITTVSNMHGRPAHVVWRNRVAAGQLAGPRIFTVGPPVRSTPLGRRQGPRSVAEAEEFVRDQRRAGYDMIKMQTGIELPVYQRLLAVARAEGIPVVGHVVEGIGSARALAAGQTTFEHVNEYLFAGGADQMDEGARAIATAGTWVGTIISDRDGHCAPPTELQGRIIRALKQAGVRLLAGTDASLGPMQPGTSLHCELVTLVAAGLTPYEALVTATRNPGEFAQRHLKERVPFGTITIGARADLVLLPADPRIDVRAVENPIGTVLRGAWLPR